MSNLYDDYGLEMEDEPSALPLSSTDTKNATATKEGGHWFRSIIALILGLVIGIGSIIGGGFLAVNSPVRPTIELIGGFAGLNYEEQIKNKFLAEEYEEKTLLEIIDELKKSIEDKTLAGINNIAPVLSEYLDTLVKNLKTEFGVTMDKNTIINTKFDELPAYISDTFCNAPLGDILKATSKTTELEPLLMEVCYGEESHYDVTEDGTVEMKEGYTATTLNDFTKGPTDILNNITFSSVLPPSQDDTLMLSMAYGREDVTYKFKTNEDGTVVLDKNGSPEVEMQPLFFIMVEDKYCDYNGNSFDYTIEESENGFIKMVKAPSYEGAESATYFLKADEDDRYYAYVEPVEGAAQAEFKKTKIGDLSENSMEMLNSIYLKDALNIKYDPNNPQNDPHAILFSLAYGIEGVDYSVDPITKEIIMLGDAHPRSIGDLRNNGTDLINSIFIADIMEAEVDDALSMYLLYGKKGIHYDIDQNGNVVMLQKYIAISEDGTKVYNEYGELLTKKASGVKGYELTETTYTDLNGNAYLYQAASPEKSIDTNDGSTAKVYYLFIDDGKTIAISEDAGKRTVYTEKGELLKEKVEGYVLGKSTFTDTDGKIYHYQVATDQEPITVGEETVKVYYLFNKESKTIAISDDRTKVYTESGELLQAKTDDVAGYELTETTFTDADGNVYRYQAENPEKTITVDGKTVKVYFLVNNETKAIAISNDHKTVYDVNGEALTKKVEGYVLNDRTYTDSHGKVHIYEAVSPEKTITVGEKIAKVYNIYEYAMFTQHSLGELAGGDHLISNMNDRLTLSEVLHNENLSSNKFLKHVSDCSVSEIPDRLESLAFTDMFSEEIYGKDAIQHEGETFTDVNGKTIEKGEYYVVAENGDITKAELDGKWKYLLDDPNNDSDKPSDYLIAGDENGENGMNALLDNMTANVQQKTLGELNDDKILNDLDDLVNKKIFRLESNPSIDKVPDDAEYIGELTIMQLLHYTTYAMDMLDEILQNDN